MSSKLVLVSDMGGVIYSFSSAFNSSKHNEVFDRVAEVYKSEEGISDELEAEFSAVSRWIEGKRGKDVLPIYPVADASVHLASNSDKYKIVIVSTSLKKTSEMILRYAFERAGINHSTIALFDIVNMSEFGSKKSPEAWEKALRPYTDIRIIVEDNITNLEAATIAIEKRGQKVEQSTVMKAF